MFDFFRKHMRVLQFLLVLLIFPSFVFFGIQSYSGFMSDDNGTVAKVAGEKIGRGEWEAAQREQIDRIRRQMPTVDAKLLDTPEMRRQSLDVVVRQRVMLAAADKLGLTTPDERLKRLFATDPQYAQFRGPDGAVSRDALAALAMSSETFAQRLRQDMSLRQVLGGIGGTAIAPLAATSAALDALFQQREVRVQRFDVKAAMDKVDPSEADIEKFYKDPANAQQFQAPEQASIEYVVLDVETLKKGIAIPEAELRAAYAAGAARFGVPEERRASHILVKAEKGASVDERAKARGKAEALLAEVRKDPSRFAEVARKNSQDPGSAEKGGDLDFFARGAMVKPFEDAAFALKPGEISDVVESDFGFHIIRLTAVKGGEQQPFEAVRGQIESELKTQRAQKAFAEAAVDFTNVVYEQPESLKPAADRWKLAVQKADHVVRPPAAGASGPLANPKFIDALFSADAIANKRNTEAIEVGPGMMASGRVLSHSPARTLPLADVRPRVRERLVAMQAAALTKKIGEERLAALRAAPTASMDGAPPLVVSRATPRDLPQPVLDAVLKAPVATLPVVVGVDLGAQGYAVARIDKVLGRDPVAGDAAKAQSQYAQAWADAESQAYYDALKTRFKVELRPAALAATPSASAAGG